MKDGQVFKALTNKKYSNNTWKNFHFNLAWVSIDNKTLNIKNKTVNW